VRAELANILAERLQQR